jgi:hypothetical protein
MALARAGSQSGHACAPTPAAHSRIGHGQGVAATRRGEEETRRPRAVLLTDSLTRRRETGEMWREAPDGSLRCVLVSETQRHPRDQQDVRRGAHNPATAGHFRPAHRTRSPCHWRAINHGQERRRAATTGHTSWQVRRHDGLFRSDSQADSPLFTACPSRARSSGQTRALTDTHETNAMTITCASAGPAGTHHSLLSSGSYLRKLKRSPFRPSPASSYVRRVT